MRRRRFRRVTIRAFIPNALTMMALCAGMTSIRFALEDRWEAAVLAFVVAAVADGLDGAMARLLKGATRFGAELDSLSDVVSFGVAPALILYQWSLSHPDLGRFGWVIALSLAISCALRLARFNSAMDDEDEPLNGPVFSVAFQPQWRPGWHYSHLSCFSPATSNSLAIRFWLPSGP